MINSIGHPLDNSRACAEWVWQPTFDLAGMVEDVPAALGDRPDE